MSSGARGEADESKVSRAESASEDWGKLRVTRKCCGASNCRNIAPTLFGEVTPSSTKRRASIATPLPDSYEQGAFTGVIRQPRNKQEYLAARTAVAACGFGAIRLEKPRAKLSSDDKGSPWKDWPRKLDEDVWVLGQPSLENYGALSYFVEHPDGGVLIDLPKPSEELFRWLEAHGGVKWLVLTHRDHVQHHAEVAARFPGCRRVMGRADVNKHQSAFADATDSVEVQLSNDLVPMKLDGTRIDPEELPDAELVLLPQPGHTPGSLCLLYRGRFLFTGDHLAYSAVRGHMVAHRLQCWGDWETQTRSVEQLAAWSEAGQLRFQWLLPGHGEWVQLDGDGSPAATAEHLRQAVSWMRGQPAGNVPLLRWIPFVMSRAKPRAGLARLVMGVGGAARDAWLLPRTARAYLTDYEPARAEARLRRLSALLLVGLSAVAALAIVVLRKR